ncbi:hypothetical protein [Arthrobacter bambusae]|uniref:PH domain-containing protein n=1 Tax=Arthrobacter bambusae TaxID=1338426 RepID=A0AAW8DAF7_9MICC|nr:hypothetical protein [Arthrobacter bambusae]MDP9904715.1 hypothetical protein [Arthrobacter bambusae]MDQ0129531.1 hypothetical protein [Arthrobacter bambusae]MDQ0180856.1 hypothetical protein [Arthrobacter bambusae]
MSETRKRSEWLSWLRPSQGGLFLMVITALRLLAQTAGHPDRASRNLFIFSTVMLWTVCLLVLFWWTFSLMKLRARRHVMRTPVAHEGAAFIARVDSTFLRALTLYSTNGKPVSMALANPIILISADGISIWKGVIAPFQVALIPRGSIGQTTLVEQRRRLGRTSCQLETPLFDGGPDQSLTWRIQVLGLLGLAPAGRKAHEEAIMALENALRSV